MLFERKYMLHDNRPMDVEAMRQAAQYLLGKHDFAAFCGNAKIEKNPQCVPYMKLTSDGSVKKSVLHIPGMDFYRI